MDKRSYVAPAIADAGSFRDETRSVAGIGFDWYLLWLA